MVSVARIRPVSRKSPRLFKGIILRPVIAPNDAFFVPYHLSNIPAIDVRTWRIMVGGEGAKAPRTSARATCACPKPRFGCTGDAALCVPKIRFCNIDNEDHREPGGEIAATIQSAIQTWRPVGRLA
jgi:hypothetical protein